MYKVNLVGHTVNKSGTYVCVPCGYKKYLEKGQKFPSCTKCMGKKWFEKGLEIWEGVSDTLKIHEN